MNRIKQRTFEVIQAGEKGDIISKVFDIFIIGLIIINVIAIIIDTFTITEAMKSALSIIETGSVVIFTIEYLLRLWTADLLYPQYGAVKSRIKYVFSFMAIIDLFAILPFYIPFVSRLISVFSVLLGLFDCSGFSRSADIPVRSTRSQMCLEKNLLSFCLRFLLSRCL